MDVLTEPDMIIDQIEAMLQARGLDAVRYPAIGDAESVTVTSSDGSTMLFMSRPGNPPSVIFSALFVPLNLSFEESMSACVGFTQANLDAGAPIIPLSVDEETLDIFSMEQMRWNEQILSEELSAFVTDMVLAYEKFLLFSLFAGNL